MHFDELSARSQLGYFEDIYILEGICDKNTTTSRCRRFEIQPGNKY